MGKDKSPDEKCLRGWCWKNSRFTTCSPRPIYTWCLCQSTSQLIRVKWSRLFFITMSLHNHEDVPQYYFATHWHGSGAHSFCFVCNTHCSKIIVIIFNMGLICSAHMMERSVVWCPPKHKKQYLKESKWRHNSILTSLFCFVLKIMSRAKWKLIRSQPWS